MKNLLQLQRNFASHIFDKKNLAVTKNIDYSNLEALERLHVYRNNVLGNFEVVLSGIFPITKKILGEKKFEQLLHKYCDKFPSSSGNLDDFGLEFPQFIKSYKPLYLKDLAQLELLLHHSYFTPKITEKFDVKNFKKLSAEKFSNLTFSLHPHCFLFTSKFRVFSIWQKEKEIKNSVKPEFALVLENQILQISEEEFLFLSLIQKKKKLFEIYKNLCQKTKKEVDIGKLINRFISNGIIINYA